MPSPNDEANETRAAAIGPASETTPLNPIREFNQELQVTEETLYSLLVKRPFAAALAFTLFCLVVLVAQSLSIAWNYDWQKFVEFELRSIELGSFEHASLKAQTTLELQFVLSGSLRQAANWLDHVRVDFEPFQVYFEEEYLVTVEPTNTIEVNLKGGLVTLDTICRDIGNSYTIQKLSDRFLGNQTTILEARGAAVISAFGIPYRTPITHTVELAGALDDDEVGSIEKIKMSYNDAGLAFHLQSKLMALDLPVQLMLPATDWTVKLEDCAGARHNVCLGVVQPLVLDLQEPNNVSVNAEMDHLPTALIAICDNNKSSIDSIVARYLNGEPNHVYVHGSAAQDTFLGRALDNLQLDLEISGKPLGEKLVDSVQVHNVRITPDGEFSGELTVAIHLPQLFDIDSSVVVGAQNIRGNFILSHNDIPFGRVPLKDWTPTVTTHVLGQYLVQVFFNHIPFTILDARELAAVSRELMFSGSVPVGYLAAVDVDVISPIAQFFISDLAIQGDTVLERA